MIKINPINVCRNNTNTHKYQYTHQHSQHDYFNAKQRQDFNNLLQFQSISLMYIFFVLLQWKNVFSNENLNSIMLPAEISE